jgi:Polysaccharide lyase family 4, domain II
VTLKQPLVAMPAVETGDASTICGPSMTDESVVVQGGGLTGVVVWLDGALTGKAPGLERRVELESDHCKLVPRVQAAMVGSAVNIIGHDELRQHLRFAAAGDSVPRATILLGGGEQVIPTELPFKKPGMVSVRDAEHPWTRAYLAVFDHPYFAVTGNGGNFTIDGVPPGKYKLNAWHERTGVSVQDVDVTANGATKVAVVLSGQ